MELEKQKPDLNQVKQAEEMMPKKNPSEPTIEKYCCGSRTLAPEKPYDEEAIINGVKISTYWDYGYNDYVIRFPQIDLRGVAQKRGVNDQVIRISQKPEEAKQVFDHASKLAQSEKDIYELYKKVENFAIRYLALNIT
jgi:hypothetical protein